MIAALGLTMNACSHGSAPLSPSQPLVIRNAIIHTANEGAPFASSMVTEDGVVVYVGDEEGLDELGLEGERTIDLGGRLVLPGLHDVHQHTLEAHLPVIDCLVDSFEMNPEAYIERVRRCGTAAGTEWVLGWGYSILTVLNATRPPRLILDDAIADRPVALMEETSHSTWVNTRALEVLGIDASTEDPIGGLILREADGTPNGVLVDSAGELPWDQALAPNDELRRANYLALLDGMAHNNEVGITSAVDARTYVARGYLDAYEQAESNGEMTCRMLLSLWASPVAEDDAQIAELAKLFRDEGGMVRVRQVKFYSDGLVENTTAALLEPYSIAQTLGPARGLSYFPEDRLIRYLRELAPIGFDAHIHAIGDRAVRESLGAIEATAELAPGARHRLTHVELIEPSDVERFAELGVAADMQLGEHTRPGLTDVIFELLGDERPSERAWLLRDLWESGATVALSSDFDVGALSPFVTIAQALDRGEQSLPDVEAAIRAYTINAAKIMRSENTTGSLEVGKVADFIVVDRNVFEVSTDQIANTQVLLTVVGGREVFRRDGFSP